MTINPAVDRREHAGPFDIVGDVHGCLDELVALLERLGFPLSPSTAAGHPVIGRHPDGRHLIFVGDLPDRGPRSADVILCVAQAIDAGIASCVCGNHDDKVRRWLAGHDVKMSHGLDATRASFARLKAKARTDALTFLQNLPTHLVFDAGRLVIAHAGIREDLIGTQSKTERRFCLFGDVSGEKDAYGLPLRRDWAAEYNGNAFVAYGHTPAADPYWRNNTVCLDTGCCFGGRLTALRYPEMETVSVPARAVYYAAPRPIPGITDAGGSSG